MFIERLINQGNAPLLERVLHFSAARQRLIGENIVNASTPGYVQKDLSVEKFQELLRDRIDSRQTSTPGTIGFEDVKTEIENPRRGILFHDGNNRTMEHLMTDLSKNALMHNMVVEMLRRQYAAMETALKERVT